ncbi:MAG: hypothetical protein B6I24_03665 [Bacteroidetes bacterium 4572_128]|nr:MAG: hypothetical protein B6I24_03665 [Bacteroidetes bacterium 4572_128]
MLPFFIFKYFFLAIILYYYIILSFIFFTNLNIYFFLQKKIYINYNVFFIKKLPNLKNFFQKNTQNFNIFEKQHFELNIGLKKTPMLFFEKSISNIGVFF